MKICHAFLFFSVRFAGGTSDLMYKICKAQEKVGLKPVIYSGDYHFDFELAGYLKGTQFEVTPSKLDKEGFSIMLDLPALAERQVPTFSVVHMHALRTYQNVVLYKKCIKYGIPYIVDAHGAVPYYTRKKLLKRLFDRLWGRKILRDAGVIIAETEVGVQEYLEIDPNLDRDKIKILSPPFDTDEYLTLPEFGAFREKFSIEKTEKIVSFLGRIHHIKGNDFLIKGFARLLERRTDVRLVLIGSDDGHQKECEQLALDLGVADKVFFPGFIAGEEKSSALVDSDIVVQMSRHEQGAWAPIEAVLCNTPIIVTRHTGAGEDVARMDAGYLVQFDDIDGLADQIDWVLNHQEEAQIKTVKARTHVLEKLSMNARINEYTELYELAKKNMVKK
jgi:glycosyltransferase involved in cell wall biosynthesis